MIASVDVPNHKFNHDLLLLCLFSPVYGHGPDANIFDELDAFWPTPNAVRTATGIPGGKNTGNKKRITQSTSRLDPDEKRILGRESIVYTNNSPDTLHYVWMQLDPNYLSKLSARGRMQTAPHMATENASLDVGYVRALEVREDYEPNLEIANVKVEWCCLYTDHSRYANAPFPRDSP